MHSRETLLEAKSILYPLIGSQPGGAVSNFLCHALRHIQNNIDALDLPVLYPDHESEDADAIVSHGGCA